MKRWVRLALLLAALFVSAGSLRAAVTDNGSIADAQSKTSATTFVFATSANCNSGEICYFTFTADNLAVTGGDGNLSEHVSLTDAAGNIYKKLAEYSNSQNAAGGGETVSVWRTKATSTLTSGSNVTLTFRAAVTAKAVQGRSFSVGAGNTLALVGKAVLANDAADPGSMTVSGLANVEHLWMRVTGHEGPNTDSYTVSTSYTAWTSTSAGTTGSTAATNSSVRTESRINTATTNTTDPTYTAVDTASLMLAFTEVLATAAIDLDGSFFGNQSSATSLTISHTVTNSGSSNGILIFQSVGFDGTDTDCIPSTVVYNGSESLTRITAAAVTSSNVHTERWYLVNPSTGTHNVVATLPNTGNCAGYLGNTVSLTGVHQTTPIDLSATGTGTSTAPAASVTTTVDMDYLISIAGYMRGSASTIWVGTSMQNSRLFNIVDAGNDVHGWGAIRGAISPAGASTDNWTQGDVGSQPWAVSITAFQPAPSSSNQVGNVTENLTTTPTVTAVLAASATLTENLTIGPSVSATATKVGNVTQNLTISPSVTAKADLHVAVTQNLTTNATVGAVKPGSFIVNVVESMIVESLVESDGADGQVNLSPRSPNIVENLNLIVNAAALIGRVRAPVESLSTVDTVNVSKFSSKVGAVVETNVTTDLVARQAVHFVAVAENNVTTDTCTTCTIVENLTTVALVTATVKRNFLSVVTESKSTVDASTGVKTLNPFAKNVVETVSESDSVLVVRGPMIFETLTTAGSVTVSSAHVVNPTETLTTSAAVSVSTPNAMNRGATELLTTSALIVVASSHVANVSDNLTTSAAVAAPSVHLAGVSENLSENDAVGVVTPTVHSAGVAEILTVGDAAATRLVLGANIFEFHFTSALVAPSTVLTPTLNEFYFSIDAVSVRVTRFGFRRRFVIVIVP